ncbi:MAG: glycosyltransferase family 9 protein [Cyclobacteriaceae bacterium]|nr:glycosyltransferase family 9 protein [Cyclobacteriaceae bacterium]
MNKGKKVLIIRFSSIGDIVLTTPVIRALKVQLEDAEVHFCTKKQYAGILQSNPYLDKVHLLNDSLNELIKVLKNEHFDYVIDLHNNLRTRIIKFRLGVQSFSYDKLNKEKWLKVNLKIDQLPNVHIVDRYLEAVRKLGIKKDQLGLDYFIPEKDEVPTEWLPATHQKDYTVYAIGAQHSTKRLTLERMITLCDNINKPIILLGGKEDAAMGDQLQAFFKRTSTDALASGLEKMNKKTLIYNACGKFNLNQSASVVKNAQYVFSHDTGLMHIAAAFKKEIYSIWGNTIPMFGMYPYKTKFTVLENNHIECRPCSKIGYNKCPKGHFKCMNDITFDFWLP